MSDYEPEDIRVFSRRMALIPVGFKWGKLHISGEMAEPFDETKFPKLSDAEVRSKRTINSYLTKLEAASNVLHTTYWLPKQGNDLVMKFAAARKKVVVDPSEPPRVPLTEESLEALYSLPLWQGGGGSLTHYEVHYE